MLVGFYRIINYPRYSKINNFSQNIVFVYIFPTNDSNISIYQIIGATIMNYSLSMAYIYLKKQELGFMNIRLFKPLVFFTKFS